MTDKLTNNSRPPKGGGGGRILPPKLIITRSKTPPKHYLPPVRVSSHPKLGTTPHSPSCMASISRQYSPAFAPSTSPAPPGPPSHYKCRSNPTSPNYLQPTFFDFEGSALHSSLRPNSASKFGRLSPGPCIAGTARKTGSSKNFHKSNSISRLLTSRSQSPSILFPNGNLSASTSPTHFSRRSPESQAQSTAHLGQEFPSGPSQTHSRNGSTHSPYSARRQQWNKFFGLNKSLEGTDFETLTKPTVTRRKAVIGRNYLDSNSTESDSELLTKDSPNNMNGHDKGSIPMQPVLQKSNNVEDNACNSMCSASLEKTKINEEKKTEEENRTRNQNLKQTMSPKVSRPKLALLGESLSIDVQDNCITGQDFGIRDYLNMTNESIDNEEESSLAGDFNIGLGIRPPRFSIDSLDSHMSMLLEMNEIKDTLLPLSNTQVSSTQTIRRNSEEIGTSRRCQNGDARNHGESSCSGIPNSVTSGPSGKLLRKSNSMPHASTLPKIHEGACTVIGTRASIAQESVGAKIGDGHCVIRMAPNHREMNQQRSKNLSRDKGTIDELEDDEDWKMDDCIVTYVDEIQEEH